MRKAPTLARSVAFQRSQRARSQSVQHVAVAIEHVAATSARALARHYRTGTGAGNGSRAHDAPHR